jgi:hypothetical protein
MEAVADVEAAPLAQRVALLVELSGIADGRLSLLAGLARSHVGLLKTGRRGGARITARVIDRLAEATGASPAWIWKGDGTPPTKEVVLAAVAKAQDARVRSAHAAGSV